MTYEKLQTIEGFGDSRISQYLEYQSHWTMDKIHMELFNYGIVFAENKQEMLSTEYSDYHVCFSGVRDKDLAEFIKARGGKVSDKWNKDTNCLIIKDLNSTSSKVKKAKDKGCKIITLEEAYESFYK